LKTREETCVQPLQITADLILIVQNLIPSFLDPKPYYQRHKNGLILKIIASKVLILV
jgi:hypothetical protein